MAATVASIASQQASTHINSCCTRSTLHDIYILYMQLSRTFHKCTTHLFMRHYHNSHNTIKKHQTKKYTYGKAV